MRDQRELKWWKMKGAPVKLKDNYMDVANGQIKEEK
jgi:hypothetical protein